MTLNGRRTRAIAAGSLLAACALLLLPGWAHAQVVLAKDVNGWQLSTDGRVNTFISIAQGTGLPDGQPDFLGGGTNDTKDSNDGLHSTRVRSGFMMNILGFTGKTELSPNLKVTTRVALWMNATGTRTKNISAMVDPRELYGKIEGNWGSLLAGSALALFGRGGILVDLQIAHDYGLGYPCGIRDASGGACGMVGFGAPFPGFESGVVYATPTLGGLQISLGLYDPATVGNAQLNRAPLPRLEGEAKFEYRDHIKLFTSGFWQVLEGTISASDPADPSRQKNLHTAAWGTQAGAMLAFGPIMLGGAAYQGAGISPITYIEENQLTADSTGTLRTSRGAFGLAAVLISSLRLKIAGGGGVWQLDKSKNDAGALSESGGPSNPQLIRQNLGATVGIYQTTGPLHFALEYFRAQHNWYDASFPSPDNPAVGVITQPKQVVNFINAGMTITW